MIENIGAALVQKLEMPDTPNNRQLAQQAWLHASRDVLNLCYRMRQAQQRYFGGEKALLGMSRDLEHKLDSLLAALLKDKQEPKLF